MSRYRKKPAEVLAARIISVDGERATFDVGLGEAEWLQDALLKDIGSEGGIWVLHDGLRVGTLEGTMHAEEGDYIVRGTHGEIYSVKGHIFADNFEPL